MDVPGLEAYTMRNTLSHRYKLLVRHCLGGFYAIYDSIQNPETLMQYLALTTRDILPYRLDKY